MYNLILRLQHDKDRKRTAVLREPNETLGLLVNGEEYVTERSWFQSVG